MTDDQKRKDTTMPDPTPRLIQTFLAIDGLIKLGPDGYPEYHEGSGLE